MIDKLPEGKLNNDLLKKLFLDINNPNSKNPKIGEDSAEIDITNNNEIFFLSVLDCLILYIQFQQSYVHLG